MKIQGYRIETQNPKTGEVHPSPRCSRKAGWEASPKAIWKLWRKAPIPTGAPQNSLVRNLKSH